MRIFFNETTPGGGIHPRTPGSAGIDLSNTNRVYLEPRQSKLVLTGKKFHIADRSIAGLLLLRSSLAMQNISLANGVGLIDSDYQGEIAVCLFNHSDSTLVISPKTRIAQLIFVKIISPSDIEFVQSQGFDHKTERGEGGFGSTGTHE